MNLRDMLGAIRSKKLEIARLDPHRGMPVLPPVGATKRQIGNAECKLGRPLSPSYRAFLTMHDGWPDLVHGTSLLGATHLARGTFDGIARSVVDLGDTPERPRGATLAKATPTIVPFGIDTECETVFAWDLATEHADGECEVVVWVNDIGARLEDFPAFLEFVDAVLEAEVVSLRAERLGPVRARPVREERRLERARPRIVRAGAA